MGLRRYEPEPFEPDPAHTGEGTGKQHTPDESAQAVCPELTPFLRWVFFILW